jgi:multidrug efflux pump subunit AcrA (membrane-fusion protein)
MTADCNIIFEERQDALLVPATAIADGGVWVVEDGALARRRVALGVTGERLVEVTSGIDETDLVVARPGRGFREGRRVRIVRPDGS